jgi:hypothetical protein
MNAKREGAPVVANREQQSRPFARRARCVSTHFSHGGGDDIELFALGLIATILVKTRQSVHRSAHPCRVIALRPGERRKAQREG